MIYSVWCPRRQVYRYFQTNVVDDGLSVPRHLRRRGPVGTTQDEAAWPLPAGAKPIGEGALARGRIAAVGGPAALSGTDGDMGWLVVGGLLLAAVGLWKVL